MLMILVFVQRKLPSPGFQLEVVLVECSGTVLNAPTGTQTETSTNGPIERAGTYHASTGGAVGANAEPQPVKDSGSSEKSDDLFSDNKAAEANSSVPNQARLASEAAKASVNTNSSTEVRSKSDQILNLSHDTRQFAVGGTTSNAPKEGTSAIGSGHVASNLVGEVSQFKAMAADASVFTFGDEEDFESD